MAAFRGIVQGNRESASRLGSKKSGINSCLNSWKQKVYTWLYEEDGKEVIKVQIVSDKVNKVMYFTEEGIQSDG